MEGVSKIEKVIFLENGLPIRMKFMNVIDTIKIF